MIVCFLLKEQSVFDAKIVEMVIGFWLVGFKHVFNRHTPYKINQFFRLFKSDISFCAHLTISGYFLRLKYMSLPDWVGDNAKELLIGAVGLSLMGVGLYQTYAARVIEDSQVSVQVADESNSLLSETKLAVDVSGAVEKPGLYFLAPNSRIHDALVTAGGLANNADRGYVSRYVNQAEKVVDGMKLYIPVKDDPSLQEKQAITMSGVGEESVSINTASLRELEELWGVGSARAQQIIDNRPYTSIEELNSKAKIPTSVVEKNSDRLHL